MMDIKKEINKIIIDAKRNNIEFNTMFAGDKEKEALRSLERCPDSVAFDELPSNYIMKVLYVDEDSFLKVGYIHGD